jgi:hypothetical protein
MPPNPALPYFFFFSFQLICSSFFVLLCFLSKSILVGYMSTAHEKNNDFKSTSGILSLLAALCLQVTWMGSNQSLYKQECAKNDPGCRIMQWPK